MRPEIVWSCPKCFASFPINIEGCSGHGNYPHTPICNKHVKQYISLSSLRSFLKERKKRFIGTTMHEDSPKRHTLMELEAIEQWLQQDTENAKESYHNEFGKCKRCNNEVT